MVNIATPESVHERDWKGSKFDESGLRETGRFKTLMKLMAKYEPDTLFDVGCGSGVLGDKVKAWRQSVILHGCDISRTALERAKEYYAKVWKVDLDREDIPATSASYDMVVCSEVVEHIYDVHHTLREVRRLLKPSGVGLLTVPNLAYWRFRVDILRGRLPIPADDDRHVHQFTRDSFAKKIKKAGMETLSVSGFRARFPLLADWMPDLFSDTLIFEVRPVLDMNGGASRAADV